MSAKTIHRVKVSLSSFLVAAFLGFICSIDHCSRKAPDLANTIDELLLNANLLGAICASVGSFGHPDVFQGGRFKPVVGGVRDESVNGSVDVTGLGEPQYICQRIGLG
ncbi:MAG: hypothetical protein A2W31_00440 [Planctomycetes bacterium RBG_16_64_10]|nr:MAG: hypothetical protein A2W31_00440 [Planctomycetes bacterium RBG_16_64_10]